ncbi:MAG: transcription elongation factor GreA [Pseudomonadota bacterium]
MQRNPITPNGKKKLEEELDRLIRQEREKIKSALAEARAMGDLSENAEYIAAKEKQSHVEGRIKDLQSKVASLQVIDITTIKSESIVFGATVKLYDVVKEITVTYQIVGDDEAIPSEGKIALGGPLAQALIGKKAGDTVIVRAPKGNIEYEIEHFTYQTA